MVIPKKDRSICTVDNFFELNKWVIHCKYPLSKIQDVYHCCKKFGFTTILQKESTSFRSNHGSINIEAFTTVEDGAQHAGRYPYHKQLL